MRVAAIIKSARPHHVGAAPHEQFHVGDVLDDLHGEHQFEPFAGIRQRLRGVDPIVDRGLVLPRVQLGSGDVCARWVDPHHLAADARQRLGQEAAATADVEHPQARKAIKPPWGRARSVGTPRRGYSRAAPD